MHEVSVDRFSLGAVRLTMYREEARLAVGSGFLWRHGGLLCVVTAWHCLTGAHYQTRQSLSRTGARPDRVEAQFLDNSSAQRHNYNMFLYDKEGSPCWLVHPKGSRSIDLAVFPVSLPLSDQVVSRAINMEKQAPIRISVGSDLFIVGFPLGIDRLGLPIWKRSSLASEPAALLDDEGNRFLIVDSATREGMSGAAVFARRETVYESLTGDVVVAPGTHTKFVGVYTGRLATSDPMSAQLGIVWPAGLVEEVIVSGIIEAFA
jgi:hypothetical protein